MSATPVRQRRAALSTLPVLALEAALLKNRIATAKPHCAGAARWKSFKDWETPWLNPTTQALGARIGDVGERVPGTFGAVK